MNNAYRAVEKTHEPIDSSSCLEGLLDQVIQASQPTLSTPERLELQLQAQRAAVRRLEDQLAQQNHRVSYLIEPSETPLEMFDSSQSTTDIEDRVIGSGWKPPKKIKVTYLTKPRADELYDEISERKIFMEFVNKYDWATLKKMASDRDIG